MFQFAFGFEGLETISLGHFRQRSDVFGKSWEVAVTFSEILVMTRRKSHTFESERVGRYTKLIWRLKVNIKQLMVQLYL